MYKLLKRIITYVCMIDKSLFFLWFMWYIYAYGLPPIIIHYLIDFYNLYNDFFIYYNKLVYPEYWEDIECLEDNNDILINKNEESKEQTKPLPKYEDKYLNDIRKMNKEWVFTEVEKDEMSKLSEDVLNRSIENRINRIEEIKVEINNLKKEMSEDIDTVDFVKDLNCEGDDFLHETTLETRNNERNKQILQFEEELHTLQNEIDSNEGICELKKDAQNEVEKYFINKKLDNLIHSYVIEKTPIGNVLMMYKRDSESFQYYSDCNIPYRYLEVVARKYVKMFNCRPILIDMEEELKLFEEKWEQEQEMKKMKEEDKKLNESKNHTTQEKKNVFAKFKSYNKEAGGKISMAVPPKNSIPNKTINEVKEDQKILLKERANRYTYEGKFANFNFLQKVERKVFNKKLGLTFADFKKMNHK